MTNARFRAVLFDKDGTLFDFRQTWDRWAADLIADLGQSDPDLESALAASIGYDLAKSGFRADSLAIAGTNREVAEALAVPLNRTDIDELEQDLARRAAVAPLVPVAPLAPLLSRLKSAGFALGVMTNDAESVALAHLTSAGVVDKFDFICGCDSGYGAKPDAAPLLAFCEAVGIDPFNTAMIGDSTHDLIAAGRAGMTAVGVLTGVASAANLAPYADAVLDDIGALPAWFGIAE